MRGSEIIVGVKLCCHAGVNLRACCVSDRVRVGFAYFLARARGPFESSRECLDYLTPMKLRASTANTYVSIYNTFSTHGVRIQCGRWWHPTRMSESHMLTHSKHPRDFCHGRCKSPVAAVLLPGRPDSVAGNAMARCALARTRDNNTTVTDMAMLSSPE